MGKVIADDTSLEELQSQAAENGTGLESDVIDTEKEENLQNTADEVRDENEDAKAEEAEDETNTEEEEEEASGDEEEILKDLPEWAGGFRDEFKENGELSEESIKKIEEEHGIPRKFTEDYITMLKQTTDMKERQAATQFNDAVYDAAGGKDAYQELINFAAENYSEKEIEAFDKAVDSKDPELVALHVSALKSRFTAQQGAAPDATTPARKKAPASTRGNASSTQTGSAKPYASREEMESDINDKRYRTDPAFNRKVVERMAASKL